MDYNEKLRLAKEALDSGHYDKETIEYIFPELKENEDERIKEVIINVFDISEPDETWGDTDITTKDIIAWLEKQGEKKTEIKYIYPKFRVGDVIEPAKPNGYSVPVRVKYIGEGYYSCESDDCKSFLSFPVCDENKYVLTEQKSYWSEEDEKFLNLSLVNLTELKNRFGEKYGKVGDCILWLKSLKDRYTWKPSDEQMNFLWKYAEQNNYDGAVLTSLFRDLKNM